MKITDRKTTRLIHLVQQLRDQRRLTVRQTAEAIGVPRSSFARHLDNGTIPLKYHAPVIRWIAEQLGVQESQVLGILDHDIKDAAPVALIEMMHGEFLRLRDNAPHHIAARLTGRWQSAQVSIFCPAVPPLFLLPSRMRQSILRASEIQAGPTITERIRRLHSAIALRICLYAKSLPRSWELILSHRAMTELARDHGIAGRESHLQELAENWQHDLHDMKRLQIGVMPDTPDAHAVERHFGDAAVVVLVDGVFRWKESADHQQVTVLEDADNQSVLMWDRQVIEVARNLSIEAATTSPQSIERMLGVRLNDQEIRREIDAEHRRRAA